VERHFEKWREKEGGLRVRLLKPFKPQLDKLARKLAKAAVVEARWQELLAAEARILAEQEAGPRIHSGCVRGLSG